MSRPFMEPRVTEKTHFWQVETTAGTELVPGDLTDGSLEDLAQYCGGEPLESEEPEDVYGHFVRLSASGYLDCTEWNGPFDAPEKAIAELAQIYDLCEHCFQTHDGDTPCEEDAHDYYADYENGM